MKNVELNTRLYPHTGFTVDMESLKIEMLDRNLLSEYSINVMLFQGGIYYKK